ncbi:MAG: metalloregulator ArsR/SmtB family transcription factor [Nodosilinea sp. WJT8-NPBG4]|jgi:ArsR family transcriptional regulator|nr:metalloregulator ArsR/SmtB family transcription factor [Nodosilinea sp. WJT8-NPBG4]
MTTALEKRSDTLLARFKALSDPLRLEVIELLRSQEMCVCDLCDRMEIAQSKLSFHLKTLREAGLISARQDGRWIYYSLNPAEFGELEDYLSALRCLSPQRTARPCPPDRL